MWHWQSAIAWSCWKTRLKLLHILLTLSPTNKMETEGEAECRCHMEEIIYKHTDNKILEEQIVFGFVMAITCPMSSCQTITVADLQSPVYYMSSGCQASLWLPRTPLMLEMPYLNAWMNFVTKLMEKDKKFMVFPCQWSCYGTIANLPKPITETFPGDMDDWLTYFPQAKLQF